MICDPCFWAAAASRFGILTLATMVLEVDEQPFPPTCFEHVSVEANFFFWRRINLFKVFLLIFLTLGTCSPVRIQFLISTVLAYGNFGGKIIICDLWVLFLAESILCFISRLRHKKIQHLANFEPQTCRFTRMMTLYSSADVFFIYTLYVKYRWD